MITTFKSGHYLKCEYVKEHLDKDLFPIIEGVISDMKNFENGNKKIKVGFELNPSLN